MKNPLKRNRQKVNVSKAAAAVEDVEQQSSVVSAPEEVYKTISEDSLEQQEIYNDNKSKDNNSNIDIDKATDQSAVKIEEPATTNNSMESDKRIKDNSEEQMLEQMGREDEKKLADNQEKVKFIKGDKQNGDAKIDIGTPNGKNFSGLTKEELMKYAKDPFWVRLRWVFFVAFWLVWIAMLAGAIWIIVMSPKCAAPTPRRWYKAGLMAKFLSANSFNEQDVASAKQVKAAGVIYELPPEMTYSVHEPNVEELIKKIVTHYKDTDMRVILDLTPNYVPKDSRLMMDAINDPTKRTAFIWKEGQTVPNNWLSLVNGTAWIEITKNNYVLSQFGDNLYDLNMNSSIVREELSEVLRHLVDLGVQGVRFKNTKFFIVTNVNLKDEVPSERTNYDMSQYRFWTHTQTTFQDGLGSLLADYRAILKNKSDDAFLSVNEDIIRPDIYKISSGEMGIDIPSYGTFVRNLSSTFNTSSPLHIGKQFSNLMRDIEGNETWLQWDLGEVRENVKDIATNNSQYDPSALLYFLGLLPGTPIIPATGREPFYKLNQTIFKHVQQVRTSPSFLHGELKFLGTDPLVAYTRLRPGNPGFLVVFNPTNTQHKGNFTGYSLPEKMSIHSLSDNFYGLHMYTKSNVVIKDLEIPSLATAILSYVPMKED